MGRIRKRIGADWSVVPLRGTAVSSNELEWDGAVQEDFKNKAHGGIVWAIAFGRYCAVRGIGRGDRDWRYGTRETPPPPKPRRTIGG